MSDKQLATGVIVEALPNLMYKIELPDGTIVRAFVSGRMKINKINVIVGDRVEFVVDTLGPNNRIVKRLS